MFMSPGLSLAATLLPFIEGLVKAVPHTYGVSRDAPNFPPFPTRSEGCRQCIVFLMFATQTERNVTVPSPENCTSPSLCWTDGLYTWTIKNVTYKENIAKCEWNSQSISHCDRLSGVMMVISYLCGAPVNEGKKGSEIHWTPILHGTMSCELSHQKKLRLGDRGAGSRSPCKGKS